MRKSGHKNDRAVAFWLWTGAGLVLLMVAIGGITRLTGSGLSMTDWNLLLGAVPPTGHESWMEVFNRYKQFPEYQQVNAGMTLAEFKKIYFWEYLHRVTGRFIGIVFVGPFLWFWYRGYFNRTQLKKLLGLFLLGAAQGGMGWFMVKSGLVDVPYVSHYRLAAHLVLAFLLFGFCVWLALDLQRADANKTTVRASNTDGLFGWMYGIGALLVLQVVWGALVAGLKAGYIYNSFPLMNGMVLPGTVWSLEPLILNFVENPALVQWSHRILGTLLAGMVILFWVRVVAENRDRPILLRLTVLVVFVLLQYLLGVFTLVYNVPLALAVAHQVMALLVFGAWIVLLHHLKQGTKIRHETS
ncbi:COX15/CtaA family protein [Halalkalibaculum sp. DA3122]|uniref:COX15/CtaA family protein n=1 Tax=unclassified Halalkalibaculum TaxID=2964617 RepID=UPI0037543F70